jgi:hypothetical protein
MIYPIAPLLMPHRQADDMLPSSMTFLRAKLSHPLVERYPIHSLIRDLHKQFPASVPVALARGGNP